MGLVDAKVTGTLNMDGLQVGQTLFMHSRAGKAEFVGDIVLTAARVGGDLDLNGAKVYGDLLCDRVEVKSQVWLGDGAEFAGSVHFLFARIGGGVELAGGAFRKDVDLTGTQIAGELHLGSARTPSARWRDNSTLTLRNARADAIQDLPDAWPPRIELTGFTYRSLGGFLAAAREPMGGRPVTWFQDWLGKQQDYAAAPYEQLASVLRNHGRPRDANAILYRGRERERSAASSLQYAWLSTLKWSIGYGYHVEWALIWVIGFIAAGMGVLWVSGEGRRNQMPYGITYSFDMLLPIIELRKKHYDIDLQGWPRYYFYVHKIMGYVLASFLIAGIAGLTK